MPTFFQFILFTLLNTASLLAANGDIKGPSLFDHWAESKAITEVTIHVDRALLETKRMTNERMPARLSDGNQEYGLEIEVRGRFRRKACVMPPLKLHFDKKWLAQIGFNNHNDFKLVTHCTEDERGQESILREQLAYELYNIVAPKASYRTQLLKVNYVDVNDGSTESSYAILIEDTDELKDRMNAEKCTACYSIPSNKVNNETRVTLFNYMIGNSDFSFEMNRNLKLLKVEGDKAYTAVPYDFDFSGLVSASYANAEKTNTIRRLVWEFGGIPNFSSTRGQFLYLRGRLLEQVSQFEELSKSSRHEITQYLNGFFEELESEQIGK